MKFAKMMDRMDVLPEPERPIKSTFFFDMPELWKRKEQ